MNKLISRQLCVYICLISICVISSCINKPHTESPYPIIYSGADSIIGMRSNLSYGILELGQRYPSFARDSMLYDDWHYVDTFYQPYNPENNTQLSSFYIGMFTEYVDRFNYEAAKCNVYRTLNNDIIYEIDITINKKDTTLANAYLKKYGENNSIKWDNYHWTWKYKNQELNLRISNNATTIVYKDSIANNIHENEVDSVKKAYSEALKEYSAKSMKTI